MVPINAREVIQQLLNEQSFLDAITSIVLVLVFYFSHRIIKYYIAKSVTDPMVRQRYWDFSRNIAMLVVVALLAGVWMEQLKTVALLLIGLLAAFLIASKEVVLGVVGRVALAAAQPYEIGDRIRINGVAGDVVDIGLIYTWLLEVGGDQGERESTGRVVVIPNLWLTMYAIFNETRSHMYLWDELEMAFPLGIDVERAIKLITNETKVHLEDEIIKASKMVPKVIRSYAAKVPPVTPITYARLERSGGGHFIVLTLRFVVRARGRRGIRSGLFLYLMGRLQEKGIPLLGLKEGQELLHHDDPPEEEEGSASETPSPKDVF